MKVRFSVTAHAIQSLVTSICVCEVSGIAENRSINVRTRLDRSAYTPLPRGSRVVLPILAVFALAKFDMIVRDVFISPTSFSTCLGL